MWNGIEAELRPKQWRIAKAIYNSPGRRIRKRELMQQFGYKESGIKTAISRLAADMRAIRFTVRSRNGIVEMLPPKTPQNDMER